MGVTVGVGVGVSVGAGDGVLVGVGVGVAVGVGVGVAVGVGVGVATGLDVGVGVGTGEAVGVGVGVIVGVGVGSDVGVDVGTGVAMGSGVGVGGVVGVGTGVAKGSGVAVEVCRAVSDVGEGTGSEPKGAVWSEEGASESAKDVGVGVRVEVGSVVGGPSWVANRGPSGVGIGVAWATPLTDWPTPAFVTMIIATPATASPAATKAIGAEGRTVPKGFIRPFS